MTHTCRFHDECDGVGTDGKKMSIEEGTGGGVGVEERSGDLQVLEQEVIGVHLLDDSARISKKGRGDSGLPP
jgi:hypothetical protein